MLWLPSSSAFLISPPPYCNRKRMTQDMHNHNRHCSDGYLYQQQQRHHTIQQHLQLSATQSENDNDDSISKRSKRKRPTSSNNQSSYHNPSTSNSRATFSTALCIIPPDNTWDTIQKARHLARDTTFYKWPPSIRLFHPFAPKYEISNLVGELANWLDKQNYELYGTEFEGIFDDEYEVLLDDGMLVRDTTSSNCSEENDENNNDILSSFEITLDSIQILPHFEVLDARLEALEETQTPKQQTLDISIEEREYQKRKAQGKKLIDEQIIMGKKRKKERERKKKLKQRLMMIENGEIDPYDTVSSSSSENDIVEDKDISKEEEAAATDTKKNSYNGPCVIYLSPNDESRIKLTTLRERLKTDLFPMYDPFSPSSSVSPYPEQLPRRRPGQHGVKQQMTDEEKEKESQFKPLLPIARFATVSDAVKVAKILQQTWDPLTFNVTDLQFISRDDDSDSFVQQQQHGPSSGVGVGSRVGKKQQQQYESDIDDIPEVRHRRKHGTLSASSSSSGSSSHQRMALTTSGEVEDISKQGIFGCDAMVMLLGEEPEESIMDKEASLTMILDDDNEEEEVSIESSDEPFRLDDEEEQEDTNNGKINYNEIFTTAEREYQRMQAHEELSTASYVGDVPIFDESVTDIEAWLDDDDSDVDDDGATVVIGRAQFFMGAMREFVGMPASSAIDSKNRIMSGGANALSRRKGAVHRATHESWDEGDYGSR